jgi:hypothetical protein
MASITARRFLLAAAVCLPVALSAQKPAPKPPADPLAWARQLYNEQKLDAAIQAALDARRAPATANAAAVVLARAYLERFAQTRVAKDLDDARVALKQVDEARLRPSEQVEFLVGLGQAFYLEGCLDGCYAAASEQFDQALARADAVDVQMRETLFEWWAVTLDKRAQLSPAAVRKPIYARVLERAEREVARPESSGPGLYWLAAAARGVDDLDRAWGAASSGWARARFLGPRGADVRKDLDRFVTQLLLPERARELAAGGDVKAAQAGLEAKWAEWKTKWE